MDGGKTLYAGRSMTMWETREEAAASHDAKSEMDLLQRTQFPWWRATRVEVVEPTQAQVIDRMKRN